jgi:TRAP-type C4-dicarboxylate transport system permease small subunit
MSKTLAWLNHYAKAWAAFMGLVITNVVTRWVVNKEPFPTTTNDWITFGVTTFGGAWLVYAKANGPKPVGKPEVPEHDS